jgi:hypothetical protein
LSTDLKITNGSQGYVRQIFTEVLPQGFIHCKCVVVEFPDSPLKLTGLPKGYFPIVPSTFSFTTKIARRGDAEFDLMKVQFTRHQLLIQPGFAVTGHSAQGTSLPKILDSLHEGGFGAYVAASRALNREGLCITHPVQLQDLRKPVGHDLYFENCRLKVLEHNTCIKYSFTSGIPMHVPDPKTEIDLDLKIKSKFVELDKGKQKAKDLSDSLISGEDAESPVRKKKKTKQKSNSSQSSGTDVPGPNEASSEFSFHSGCQWSSVNYSCAYDAVFMTLYSIYKCQRPEQQIKIREELNKYGMLGNSLELISQPGLQTTERFNFSETNSEISFLLQRQEISRGMDHMVHQLS